MTLIAQAAALRSRAMLFVAGIALVVLMLASTSAHAYKNPTHITNLSSGLKADVMWASTAQYQGVFLWPDNASQSQMFDVVVSTNGSGDFNLRARHSGQCLAVDPRYGNYNGTRVVQVPCTGHIRTWWRRGWVSEAPKCSGNICSQTSASFPILINRSTGRCLDANNGAGGAPKAQAILQQWDCIKTASVWNAGNQIWGFDGEGYL